MDNGGAVTVSGEVFVRGRGAEKHTKVGRKERRTEKETSLEHRHETGRRESEQRRCPTQDALIVEWRGGGIYESSNR